MAEKQVMIAVSEGLRDWLREEADRLEMAYAEGWYQSPYYNPTPANPTRPHLTIANVIEIMLESRREHRARRRKAKLNRKGKKSRRPSSAAMGRV